MIDLLVAGGGPAGLATAINAALAGLAAVVVEPRTGSIDKACGEGLMPDAVSRLRRIGVEPEGVDFTGIRYVAGERVAQARFTSGPGRGVRRTALHEAMRQRAHDLGVGFVVGRVADIVQDADSVEAAGIRSRYLVGADGLLSSVRRSVGLSLATAGRQRYGIRQHFGVSPWSDLVEVHWLPDVEVYVTPVAPDVVGVAVLGAAPLHLDAALAALPELSSHLGAGPRASIPRGAGPLRQRARARCTGRVLLVGDAGGYVDALTGEGLRIAFAEAEAAVSAILRDDPSAYEVDWQRITRSYRWLTSSLLWASSRRPLRPMIVPAARSLPFVFSRIVDRLAA